MDVDAGAQRDLQDAAADTAGQLGQHFDSDHATEQDRETLRRETVRYLLPSRAPRAIRGHVICIELITEYKLTSPLTVLVQ